MSTSFCAAGNRSRQLFPLVSDAYMYIFRPRHEHVQRAHKRGHCTPSWSTMQAFRASVTKLKDVLSFTRGNLRTVNSLATNGRHRKKAGLRSCPTNSRSRIHPRQSGFKSRRKSPWRNAFLPAAKLMPYHEQVECGSLVSQGGSLKSSSCSSS